MFQRRYSGYLAQLVLWDSQTKFVTLALLYNAKDVASFYSGHRNTGTNPNQASASVGPNSRLLDRRVLDKFPRSQHRPSLITPPRFAMAVPSMPVKRWNFRKAKWSHNIALKINSQRLCCRLIHLMLMRLTRTFATPLRKQPKRLSHAGIETTMFRVGMQSMNPCIKLSCSLLRETTQVWLLQLCLPSLTGSGWDRWSEAVRSIDFSHSSRKAWSILNNLLVGHDTLFVTVPFQPMLLHFSWLEMGNTRF